MGWPKGKKRKATKQQLENLKKHQVKPGECLNPEGGRSHVAYKQKLLSAAYREELARVDPKTGKTIAALIAEGQARSAVRGNTFAAKEIREVMEGRTPQRIQIDATMEMNLANATEDELNAIIFQYVERIGELPSPPPDELPGKGGNR